MAFLYLIGAFAFFFFAFGISWTQDTSVHGDDWWQHWHPSPESPIGSFIVMVKTVVCFGIGLYCAMQVLIEIFK
jgi:hypothetical protein